MNGTFVMLGAKFCLRVECRLGRLIGWDDCAGRVQTVAGCANEIFENRMGCTVRTRRTAISPCAARAAEESDVTVLNQYFAIMLWIEYFENVSIVFNTLQGNRGGE